LLGRTAFGQAPELHRCVFAGLYCLPSHECPASLHRVKRSGGRFTRCRPAWALLGGRSGKGGRRGGLAPFFWPDRVTAYSSSYKGLPLPTDTASPVHSPPSIRFRTRIDPSSPQTLDRELAATARLVVVRVLRRRCWRLAEGGAGVGSSSPWSVWTSSPEHPGSVLRLRQAPDLLPPRMLEQPPLLWCDVLLPLHRAVLLRLLPDLVERRFHHRFAQLLPLP
jgi:hypothetical protein